MQVILIGQMRSPRFDDDGDLIVVVVTEPVEGQAQLGPVIGC
jgi:hypothetical protein